MSDLGDLYQSGLSCSKQLTLIPKSLKGTGLQVMTPLSLYIFCHLANMIQTDLQGKQQSNTAVTARSAALSALHITDHTKHK